MGFLDDLLNDFNASGGIGGLLRDNPQLVSAATRFFGNDSSVGPSGGLSDILSQLQASGLGDAVGSWLGSGQNEPVSPGQVRDALGEGQLSQFAEHAGIDLGQAATVLAGMLPQIVDQLSPQGSLRQDQPLGNLLGGLLGRGT